MNNTETPERITEHNEYGDWMECLCGNTPESDGFYTSLADGEYIEPLAGSAWEGLTTCASCGRIINPEAWLVVGQAVEGFAERYIAKWEADFDKAVAR